MGVCVAVGVCVADGVGVAVTVAVGIGVTVGVLVGVALDVRVAAGAEVLVGVAVGGAVGVGVSVGISPTTRICGDAVCSLPAPLAVTRTVYSPRRVVALVMTDMVMCIGEASDTGENVTLLEAGRSCATNESDASNELRALMMNSTTAVLPGRMGCGSEDGKMAKSGSRGSAQYEYSPFASTSQVKKSLLLKK